MLVWECHVMQKQQQGPDIPVLLRRTKDVSWQCGLTYKLTFMSRLPSRVWGANL